MKRAIIVHCWDGTPNYCWYPWVARELKKWGFQVTVPAMPETQAPKQHLWVPTLGEAAGEPDENLYLVGHSAGVITILRYLETLAESQKIGGVISVAGFTDSLGMKELENFFQSPIQWEKITPHLAHGAVALYSDNDPYVSPHFGPEIARKLGGNGIEIKGLKHFSGPVDQKNSCTKLPEVIEAINALESR